jgi:hypothetical protein
MGGGSSFADSKPSKKKGVGYGTDAGGKKGKEWDVDEFLSNI